MSALATNSLPDLQQAADTLLRDCMPADWSWEPPTKEVKRLIDTAGADPFGDAKNLFACAVLEIAERHRSLREQTEAIGAAENTIFNLRKTRAQVRKDSRFTEEALAAARVIAAEYLPEGGNYRESILDFDREICLAAVRMSGGNLRKAAYGLGLHRNTIFQILNRQTRYMKGAAR